MRLPQLLSRFTFYFLILAFLTSCVSSPDPLTGSGQRLEPATPQLIFLNLESAGTWQLVSQTDLTSPFSPLPYSIPSNCFVYNLYPNPVQSLLAVELLCGDQARVEIFDTQTGKTFTPIEDIDSRFLAWTPDGKQIYLKTDTLGNPQVVHVYLRDGREEALPFPSTLYDLAFLPDGKSVLYSTTPGIGFGSEVWLAEPDGKPIRRVFADPQSIVAYLRPSPDGTQVAFILFPDSQVPFPNGELWVMNVDGADPRRLAAADAGHGYAPAWLQDGTQIAFVVRENASDPQVEQSAAALISNVYRIEIQSGAIFPVTQFTDAIVESPVWSPDGNSIAFNIIRNGKIQAWVYVMASAASTPLGNGFSCCAVWLPGR
jgi:Tol biopolymer transport system component